MGEGGVCCQTFYFVLFSLFSRPRAELATVLSSFFGLATNTRSVRNNNKSVEYNGGLLPDIILLTQGYYYAGAFNMPTSYQ